MKIHEQIKEARKAAGMTQKQLSDKIGCKYQHLQRIERTGACTASSLQAISDALGVALYIAPKIIVK